MPRRAAPAQFADDQIVIAGDGIAAQIDGEEYTVPIGSRVRADHPVVKAHPWAFYADGTIYQPPERQVEDDPKPEPPKAARWRVKEHHVLSTSSRGQLVLIEFNVGDIIIEGSSNWELLRPELRRRILEPA